MRTNSSEPNLLMTLLPSKRFITLVRFAYLFAGVGILANGLAWAIKLGLFAGLLGHFFVAKRWRNLQTTEIAHNVQSGWIINGEPVIILPSSTLSQWAIFLQYKPPFSGLFSGRSVVIFCDALSEDDFRRLQVRLKTSFIDRQAMWVDGAS